MDALRALLKQPHWVILLLFGAILTAIPYISVDKDHSFTTHPPITLVPVVIGAVLIILGVFTFGVVLWQEHQKNVSSLDFSKVSEKNGVLSTTVGDCEIRVCEGRIETQEIADGAAVVLPCNEYFDDRCVGDVKSALGAYVSRVFSGQIEAFTSLMKSRAKEDLGPGTLQQKTEKEQALSFGTGRCLLLQNPLGKTVAVSLVSTTTQRAGTGLTAEISCLFDAMHELTRDLADARINEVTMPLLGGGHGGINPPLAFIGLILAIAEAARYGHGAQRLRRVTVVVFKSELYPAVVDRTIIRRTLALVGM